ncbi:MAG: 30S ribosomal protein S6 [Patescibacteria group bacterium]
MDKESDPKLYEISYLARAADDQAALECAALVGGAIEKEHGIIATQNQPTRKVLSYPVGGEKEGWWGWIKFMARPEALAAIEQSLKDDSKKIVRFAIFKVNRAEMSERPARKRRIIQTPAAEKTDIAEIDKKLEEMLGK